MCIVISETTTTVAISHQGKFLFFSRVQKRTYANLRWVVDRNLLQIHFQLNLLFIWTSWISLMCKTRCQAILCSRSQLLGLGLFLFSSLPVTASLCWHRTLWILSWILRFGLSLTAFYPFVIKLFLCTVSHDRQWQKAATSKNLWAFFSLGKTLWMQNACKRHMVTSSSQHHSSLGIYWLGKSVISIWNVGFCRSNDAAWVQ